MLEHPRFPSDKRHYICEGYDWKEDVFISPFQSWIDKACENHDLPWCNLLVSKRPCLCQKKGFESCVFLLLLVEYIQYVDHMLVWFHWHFDIT